MGGERVPVPNVVLLMTDVEGSTALWEREPGAMAAALAVLDELVGATVAEHGGTLVKPRGEGDSHFVVFDSPLAAVACAAVLQRRLEATHLPTSQPLLVRAAVHAGPVDVRDGDYYGLTVNRCARLRACAWGGQTLTSGAVAEAIGDRLPSGTNLVDLGMHRLRDLRSPERVWELVDPALERSFPPIASLSAARHNLPIEVTSFIGREGDVAEISNALTESRLVSVCGPGGLGKTRLAVHVGASLVDDFSDGVWFVELADLADPELVPSAVAAAAGLRVAPGASARDVVAELLPGRRTLVILDNCEHLLSACSELTSLLLQRGLGLRLLTTSREPLHVPGERVLRPRPLTAERGDGENPAVRLFADRARSLRSSFRLDDQSAASAARICERLDGLPLAIELAAGRTSHLSVQQIEERLDRRLRLIASDGVAARHRTLEAAIAWSHDLLELNEQVLFRRLSVFRGTFSVDAAERVCAGGVLHDSDVIDVLARLTDRSLVDVEFDETSEARYRLLQTVLGFAQERLAESGEAQSTELAHLRWSEATARDATIPVEALNREIDNFRVALDVAEATAPHRALQLAADLSALWEERLPAEGISRLEDLVAAHPVRSPARVSALNALAQLLQEQDVGRAEALHDEARRLAEALGDGLGELQARIGLGAVAALAGDIDRSLQLLSAAHEDADAGGATAFAAHALRHMARAMLERDIAAAQELLERASTIDAPSRSSADHHEAERRLAAVLIQRGDYAEALAILEATIAHARQAGDELTLGSSSVNYGRAAMALGDHDGAREALAVASDIGDRLGNARMHAFANALLGELARKTGAIEEARLRYVEARQEFIALGTPVTANFIRLGLGHLDLAAGDLAGAHAAGLEVLRVAVDEDLPFLTVEALDLIGESIAAGGDAAAAVAVLSAAEERRALLDLPREPVDHEDHSAAIARCRSDLGDSFDEAWLAARDQDVDSLAKEILKMAQSAG